MSPSVESSSLAAQAATRDQIGIAVMKKSADVQQDTAEALVELIKQATPAQPEHVGTRLNVVA